MQRAPYKLVDFTSLKLSTSSFDSAMRRFEPSRPSQAFRAFRAIHSDSIWSLILTLGLYLLAKLVSSSAPLNEVDINQVRSKRSAFITLFQAATKSCTNFSFALSWA